jgi:hypothetical protein
MELSDRYLEKIREAARGVEYGSVTINISMASTRLELSINKRMRFDDEPEEEKAKVRPKNSPPLKKA